MTQEDVLEKENGNKNIIYLSIDHLKKGSYNLRITLKNKVIKSVFFNKDKL
ncbi:hypothetical protein [Seonamhaeicola maritimus]|uniref:hypothetical protein n=1 Tax=Seonamhaeicola maritimus TaxID=2591822 RepID=UPI0014789E9A|nr:hypothetical protein [Seonamhaeicola maritimus]